MKKSLIAVLFLTLFSVCYARLPDSTGWKTDTMPTGPRIYPANNSKNDGIFVKKNAGMPCSISYIAVRTRTLKKGFWPTNIISS
ncbi:MAG: hypothetical protein EOO45_13230 [Flavobacterium sp.]|nr:MAG: hypothetical protein EOO45_13230 [Flavobacterium sp.]